MWTVPGLNVVRFGSDATDLAANEAKSPQSPSQQVHCEKNDPNSEKLSSGNNRSDRSNNTNNNTNGHASSLQSLSIGEILEAPEADNMGVSAILNYCKIKILRPYLRLLAIMGFRPLSLDITDPNLCIEFIGVIYTVLVIALMLCGYMLQFMACFRRDRGFCYITEPEFYPGYDEIEVKVEKAYHQTCYGSMTFSYIIPSVLHLTAYLYSLYVFRVSNNEQLQSMMERVFLLSSGPYEGTSGQRSLLKILWAIIGFLGIWATLSLTTVIFMLEEGNITFQWLQTRFYYFNLFVDSGMLVQFMKVMTIVCTFLHDLVLVTVVCSYCIQAQLLKSHIHFLKARLLQHFISPLEWMREVAEFRKSLNYLNDGLAPPICIFTIINLSWALSGMLWLMGLDPMDIQTEQIFIVSFLNVFLWFIISLAPFIQASRLTAACIMMQTVGHEVRIRPLAYQTTPGQELDSILLYASSLKMNAKLFNVPITGRCLYLTVTILAIVIITLGQCHFLIHDS